MRRLLSIVAIALLWAAPAFATISINVANAPAWVSGASYVLKNRVVAGAAWNGSAYTNGSALCLFAVEVAGIAGSDPTIFNTACSSGTATGVGGGLDGSIPAGWSGATTVTDGGVTWILLVKALDYVTLTGEFGDTTQNWASKPSGTCSVRGPSCYYAFERVINGGNIYLQTVAVGTTPYLCQTATSGSGPTATTITNIPDNTCNWVYQGPLTYSSQANIVPTQLYIPSGANTGSSNIQYADNIVSTYWYGGSGRTEYVDGANGEADPIMSWYHDDYGTNDNSPLCQGSTTPIQNCNGTNIPWLWTHTVAPGDSFEDNLNLATTALRYGSAPGVSFHSTSTLNLSSQYSTGQPVIWGDAAIRVTRIQLKSDHAQISNGLTTSWGNGHADIQQFDHNILDAGGGPTVVAVDASSVVSNNLVIYRGSVAGSIALLSKFASAFFNNTIVGASTGTVNSTCMANYVQSLGWYGSTSNTAWPPTIANNPCFGFANQWAIFDSPAWPTTNFANNATDGSATPSTTPFTDAVLGHTFVPAALPGSTYSLTESNQFVDSTMGASEDWRVKGTGADIYGAGANFSQDSHSVQGTLAPGADIVSTSRGPRYDIGAAQFVSVPLASMPLGSIVP